ncbi:ribbon-helix-helix domain-containing protein [Protaetiibacter intestinalis]|uniref:Uncharacterized protein n=1 Tax=Protaetiibacter intestinalis TaxID=2419774 RepID=A0A387BET2_9MICO|nr:CopG family transcriptional regulator [Protaetiibacter intestinalis]AYF96990.1 hypothetical protein D7I47_01110 [Protaetiibacter intestinalis]
MTDTAVAPALSVLRGVRRVAVIAIIVSLVVAAALGIFALLSGDFGQLQGQILLTTLTVAAFGTTALCHLAVVRRAVRAVGYVGIAVSVGAAASALVLIWYYIGSQWDDGATFWWKALAVLSIAALSLAQANLLLLLADRPQLAIRIALGITLVAIAVVAVMLAVPTLSDGEIPGYENGETYWRIFGVIAILDVLGTIALPVLGLVLRREGAGHAPHEAVPPAPDMLALDPELAARLDAAAQTAGVPREQFARELLARALDTAP